MLGSGITGGLVMLFGSTLRAPHGGIWVTPLIGNPLLYLLAIAIGTVVTAVAVIALKAAGPGPVKTELDAGGLAEVVVS
jgi:PTS system fructose-specific IIC component